MSATNDAIGYNYRQIIGWNFEFGYWNLFEIWYLELGIFVTPSKQIFLRTSIVFLAGEALI